MYNSRDAAKVKKFEQVLFKNEDIAVALKVFRRMGLDLAKDRVARDLYGAKVPRFIAFDSSGRRVGEVYLKDYRARAGDLMKLLVRASKGHGQMPLRTFVKKYRSFLNELDRVEGKKGAFAQKKKRARGNAKKLARTAKAEKAVARREASILAKERKLLAAVGAYDADPASGRRTVASASGSKMSGKTAGKASAKTAGKTAGKASGKTAGKASDPGSS